MAHALLFLFALVPALTVQSEQAASPEAFGARLERAAAGEFDASLVIEVESLTDRGPLTATVFGEGAGVWGGRTAFTVGRDGLRSLLSTLARAGFASMPESFGGRDQAGALPPLGGPAVTTRVSVRLDDADAAKEVVQLNRGEQSEAFKRLALDLLGLLERPAASGAGVASLDEALRKVAAGGLSAALLEVVASHGPEEAKGGAGARWMLSISGGLVEARRRTAAGLSEPARLRPDAAVLRDLARALVEHDVAGLPANVVSDGYTDLSVRILGRSAAVQARAFARGRADAALQRRLAGIVEALARLEDRASKAAAAR